MTELEVHKQKIATALVISKKNAQIAVAIWEKCNKDGIFTEEDRVTLVSLNQSNLDVAVGIRESIAAVNASFMEGLKKWQA